ncbi:MAG: hypothetical protein JWM11_7366 [Planctomycetaceae bacterium]|nr:hypothetical protein [Planctomycetaceae bacterium]
MGPYLFRSEFEEFLFRAHLALAGGFTGNLGRCADLAGTLKVKPLESWIDTAAPSDRAGRQYQSLNLTSLHEFYVFLFVVENRKARKSHILVLEVDVIPLNPGLRLRLDERTFFKTRS